MSIRDIDGQMDFLGLITEYTDNQGATVRVREPGKGKSKPIPPPEFEQITMDFESDVPRIIKNDKEETAPKVVITSMPSENKIRINEVVCAAKNEEPEQVVSVKVSEVSERVSSYEPTFTPEEKKEKQVKKIRRKKESTINDTTTKVELPLKEEDSEKEVTDEKETVSKAVEENTEAQTREALFKQCKRCWCFDCKHNTRNEAVPREICGTMMACPACNDCIAEDMATVCEINNAKEGCRTRALEEGIVVEEEYTEG